MIAQCAQELGLDMPRRARAVDAFGADFFKAPGLDASKILA